jgi:LytR cell envelope-related transcriptional attenuator
MEVERWRHVTIVVTFVATVELALLAAAGIALIGNPFAGAFKAGTAKAAAATHKTKASAPTHPALPRGQVSVIVLNGNGHAGAAAAAARRVKARGYIIGTVGNAPHPNGGRSVVMYRPGYEVEARRFARDLRVRIVSPLDGMRPRQLMGSHLVLVLGTAG